MENVTVTGVTNYNVKDNRVPLGEEEREDLLVRATNVLKKQSDEVLESIVELLEDLGMNAGMRQGLKSFQENGWAFFSRTTKLNGDSGKPQETSTSSSITVDLEKVQPNSESRLNYENHPMNNELILKKIFEFSSVNELKNCRLVSKKWRDLSLNSWRGKAALQTVKLFRCRSHSRHFNYDEDKDEMKAFVKNGSKFLEVPFRRYTIYPHCYNYTLVDREKVEMILEFFNSSIQHLSIQCENLDTLLMVAKLPELRHLHARLECQQLFLEYISMVSEDGECPFEFRNLQSVTSKLHTLELDLKSSDLYNNTSFLWKKIFESFPTLKSLRLNPQNVWSFPHEQIIGPVCEVRREGNFSTLELEELTINRLPDHVLSRIVECQFPLRTLYIKVESRNSASMISNLFEAHAETIEYIDLEIRCNECRKLLSEPYLSSTIKLPNLKELVLRTGLPFPNILCSFDVPNLEDLKIKSYCFTYLYESDEKEQKRKRLERLPLNSLKFRDSCILPNLKKFLYDDIENLFSSDELRILGKVMPNLTDLGIPLGNQTFPILYELWPRLQSLHLVATELTYLLLDDCGITGFPNQNYCYHVPGVSRESNITNLRNLKKFVLETKMRLNRGKNSLRPRKAWITDVSAVNGFLQLPKLGILQLETLCDFSPKVMMALKNHVWEIKIREPDIFVSLNPPGAYVSEDEDENALCCEWSWSSLEEESSHSTSSE